MTVNKPLILVTNDDGYRAKGIRVLVESLKGLGEIVVVAPDGPRSGMSSAITIMQPLRYHLLKKEDDLSVYACTGTPVDCVKIAISRILDRKPDIILSGVNHGSNASISVLYSGTMGAAIEGCIFGIPSIGFSLLDHHHDADFCNAEEITRKLSAEVLKTGLPNGICLNVNIPQGTLRGTRVCRQTSGQWIEEFLHSKDGAQKDVFWLTGSFSNFEPHDEATDEWALTNKYISIVPVKIDMTAHDFVDQIKEWEDLI